jgi:hypothetical protein
MLGTKRTRFAAIGTATALLILLASGCGPGKPVVKSVNPNKGLIGTGFKVSGISFGKTQLKSTVTVGGKKSTVVSWSDTSITATVPLTLTAGTYPLVVKTAGGPGNKVSYTVYATFTGSTPLPAMLEFLKNRKIDTTGMNFAVVATSTSDPNWKLDEAVASDGKTYYFLFHKTKDGWTIKDFGTTLTADQMQIDGAPGDLKPPS